MKKNIDNATAIKARNYALFEAIDNNNVDSLKFLIENNADVNFADIDGSTPLFYAIHVEDFDITKFLIENNADVNSRDRLDQTPLFSAMSNENTDIIKLLLDKVVDVNYLNYRGQTPLFSALSNENIDIITLLLEKGADINIKDQYCETPLLAAIYSKNINITKLLLDKGAKIDFFGQKYQALQELFKNNEGIVKLLKATQEIDGLLAEGELDNIASYDQDLFTGRYELYLANNQDNSVVEAAGDIFEDNADLIQ